VPLLRCFNVYPLRSVVVVCSRCCFGVIVRLPLFVYVAVALVVDCRCCCVDALRYIVPLFVRSPLHTVHCYFCCSRRLFVGAVMRFVRCLVLPLFRCCCYALPSFTVLPFDCSLLLHRCCCYWLFAVALLLRYVCYCYTLIVTVRLFVDLFVCLIGSFVRCLVVTLLLPVTALLFDYVCSFLFTCRLLLFVRFIAFPLFRCTTLLRLRCYVVVCRWFCSPAHFVFAVVVALPDCRCYLTLFVVPLPFAALFVTYPF